MKRKNENDWDDGPRTAFWKQALAPFLIFLLALVLRLWFNFYAIHPNNYLAADAAEYMRDAVGIINLHKLPSSMWADSWAVLKDQASPEVTQHVRNALVGLKELKIAGPIFPIFLAISILAGDLVDASEPVATLIAHCFVCALTCVFIQLAAAQAWNARTGIIAGLLAVIYPAFIVNSGRLYSESFAAMLMSVVMWLAVRGFQRPGNRFWLIFLHGLLSGWLQQTRSILILAAAALIPITALQKLRNNMLVAVLCFVAGLALAVVPWMACQKIIFGKSTVVVDRTGNYNAFTGNDPNTGGWLAFPYADLSMIERKSMPGIILEQVKRNPKEWLRVMLDKPARMFKFPWNDFRTSIGKVRPAAQMFFHQALLMLAAWGLVLGFAASKSRRDQDDYDIDTKQSNRRQLYSLLCIFLLFLCTTPNIMFITIPRYNLTSIPGVLVFAAIGMSCAGQLLRARGGIINLILMVVTSTLVILGQRFNLVGSIAAWFGGSTQGLYVALTLWSLSKMTVLLLLAASLLGAVGRLRKDAKLSRVIVGILTVLVILPLSLPVSANGRWFEWRLPIASGKTIKQEFTFNPQDLTMLSGRQVYLLIDADKIDDLANLQISVNGHPLDPVIIPGLSLLDTFERRYPIPDGNFSRECEYIFDCMTRCADISNAQLRQWFLIPVPVEALIPPAVGNFPVTVAITQRGEKNVNLYGEYQLRQKDVTIPSIDLYSWEKAFYSVENPRTFSDPRYELRLPLKNVAVQHKDMSDRPGLQWGFMNVRLVGAPRGRGSDHIYTVEIAQPYNELVKIYPLDVPALDSHQNRPASFAIRDLPEPTASDYWFVTVSGKILAEQGDPKPALQLTVGLKDTKDKSVYVSPWVPRYLKATNGWQDFHITIPLHPSALGAPLDFIKVTFLPVSPQLSRFTVPPDSTGITKFSDVHVQIRAARCNPLTKGFQVF